jgi:iron complex transport system substrate-binding protein
MILRTLIAAILVALAAPAQQPARIVSTSPSITETLFALNLGDRVVGVTTYCRYPAAVLPLPKIGTYSKPDPEKIARLRPDLVIIHHSAAVLAGRLEALGIRYSEVRVGSLAEVYTMIGDIALAAGVPDRAKKLNGEIRSKLQAESTSAARPKVLMLVGRNPGLLTDLIAVSPGTYLGELLEIAGGRNVLSDSTVAYPHISLETVVRLNPDVILDSSVMGEAGADHGAQEERLRQPWLVHRELAAVQTGRVFGLTSESLVTPGPRVVDAVAILREKIRAAAR